MSDLVEIQRYIGKDKPDTARDVASRIKKAVEVLAVHSSMGRPGRIKGTRELVLPDLPYIIPYRAKNDFIEILRVFHGARKLSGGNPF